MLNHDPRHHRMEQGTDDWHRVRLGKVTASQIHKIFVQGSGKTRRGYMQRLLDERRNGYYHAGFTTDAMLWGTETEPEARRAYESHSGIGVHEVGFIDHPLIAWAGASPDGLVGDMGLLEIKCPNSDNHLKTFRTGTIPTKYHMQIQWQLACTGREWCDFVSFDPRTGPERQLFVKRLHADHSQIKKLEAGVRAFLAELDYYAARI